MARPVKDGLDYFPLDVDIDQDEKVAIIEAKHGVSGFALVIKLFMRIYKNGYFYEWGEKEQLLFSKIVNEDINSLNVVVNDCIKWGLFDEDMFQTHGILTSRGIQTRYLEATSRRKEPKIIGEYCLLSEKEINEYNYLVIVDINGDSKRVINNKSTQSKVKESKVKKTDDDALIFFDKNIARISEHVKNQILTWIDDLGEEVVLAAMKKAADNDATTYSYVSKILIEWHKNSLRGIEQVRNFEKRKQNKKTITFNKNAEVEDDGYDYGF